MIRTSSKFNSGGRRNKKLAKQNKGNAHGRNNRAYGSKMGYEERFTDITDCWPQASITDLAVFKIETPEGWKRAPQVSAKRLKHLKHLEQFVQAVTPK